MNALYGISNGWKNHPAVKMWKGSEEWLVVYGIAICGEWKNRGYKDTCAEKILKFYRNEADKSNFPKWLMDDNSPICISHRSALLFKNYKHYSQFGWDEAPEIKYYWPTKI